MSVAQAYHTDNLKFKYDDEHDVLHLFFGESKVSSVDELAPGIFVRFADDDDSITGAIIMDYRARNKKQLQNIIPVNVNFNSIDRILH
jgi:hypothetical protein